MWMVEPLAEPWPVVSCVSNGGSLSDQSHYRSFGRAKDTSRIEITAV